MSSRCQRPEPAWTADTAGSGLVPNEALGGEVFEVLARALPGHAEAFGELDRFGGPARFKEKEDLVGCRFQIGSGKFGNEMIVKNGAKVYHRSNLETR
jgi:hypothetical protein